MEAESTAEVAEPPAEKPAKTEKCLHVLLQSGPRDELLKQFPPAHPRVLGERVWLRPCVIGAREDLPLRALAYAEDSYSQSLLVSLDERTLSTASDAEGGQGYPVVPLSLADEPPPAPKGDEDEGPSVAEQVEDVWRLLETAGVLEVERDADALPTSVSLIGGGVEWRGELSTPTGPRMVRVVTVKGLALPARAVEPECGFCRFMKAGPCGEEFVAWEACIDQARDQEKDFVDLCGKQTLLLKACTDKHPEYYGELSGGGGDEKSDEAAAEPPAEPPVEPPAEAKGSESGGS